MRRLDATVARQQGESVDDPDAEIDAFLDRMFPGADADGRADLKTLWRRGDFQWLADRARADDERRAALAANGKRSRKRPIPGPPPGAVLRVKWPTPDGLPPVNLRTQ